MTHLNVAPEGFFEFSTPQDTMKSLDSWVKWFKSRRVKTTIVKNNNGSFVLCREGKESTSDAVERRDRKKVKGNDNG